MMIVSEYLQYIQDKTQIKRKFYESRLHEIFSAPSDIYNLPAGTTKDMQMLRLSIIAEYDAVDLYEAMAEQASDVNVQKIFLSVAKEEKQHIGEFEFLLQHFDDEHTDAKDEGAGEVEDETGLTDEED